MTYAEALARLEAHKAVCKHRPVPGDRRSGSSVCPTCWSLVSSVEAAKAQEEAS